MVHWPKSTAGKVMTVLIALIVGLGLVQSAIALSGTFVWITLAVAALAVCVAVVVHRRAQEASDLALADAPSFADVLPQGSRGGEAGTDREPTLDPSHGERRRPYRPRRRRVSLASSAERRAIRTADP
jgi:hypothetical protein